MTSDEGLLKIWRSIPTPDGWQMDDIIVQFGRAVEVKTILEDEFRRNPIMVETNPAALQSAAPIAEREAFEKWHSEYYRNHLQSYVYRKNEDGSYQNAETRNHYGIWQARAALSAPAIPEGHAKDTERLNWMQEEDTDTIYMDDGRLIDVGGKHSGNLRAAIDAAIAAAQIPASPKQEQK